MKKSFIKTTGIVLALALLLVAANKVEAFSLSARMQDQSTDVAPGDRLYFEVDVKYPENPIRKDLRVEYRIIEEDKVIATEKVLRAVETQVSFLDYIVVPKSAKGGIHNLSVIVSDYDVLHKEVSASFMVTQGLAEITIYFFVLVALILMLGIMVMLQVRIALSHN